MLQKLKERRDQKGFTIIEVLIVLAIAGLIMLVVFLAVPALQRNSRNTQRNNDISSIVGAINEYINNSGGQTPASCTGASGGSHCAFLDNAKLGYYAADTATNFVYTRNSAATTIAAPTSLENVAVGSFSTCNATGTASSTTNATSRSIAVVYQVETGSGMQTQCKTIQ